MLDRQQFDREGFARTPSLLSAQEIAHCIALIEANASPQHNRGGVRDIMHRVPELQSTANHANVRSIVDRVLDANAFAVRSTLFDKTESANWKVPWHQDVTIAVQEKRDADGYGPWSIKDGVTHVQAPTQVLERMLTVRIPLDPCPADNGALRVMPGSHRLGRIHQNDALRYIHEKATVCCTAEAGDALIMRPLLLHGSSASTKPAHRRVLHFDFAADNLANGLTWRMR